MVDRHRFDRLFTSRVIGLLLCDVEKVKDANDAFLRMAGYTRDEFAAGAIQWRDITPAELVELDRCAVQELISTGDSTPYEKEFVRKDGSRFAALVAASIVGREPLEWACFVLDISERKRIQDLNAQLLANEQAARLAAESANRTKDEFLAMISHELHNPLHSILGFCQLLESGRLDELGKKRAIEIIHRSAKAQMHLINDLLDLSRIAGGKLHLNVSEVEVSQIIYTALEMLRPEAEAKGITVFTSFPDSKCAIHGDSERLDQVVWNLLVNAIKFTPRGGRVNVRLEANGLQLRIVVSDTGRGISPAFLPHVFDPFAQAKPHRRGLGLGLAIVRHIVALHGGTVEAASQGEGLGATFTVTLPIRVAAA